MKTSIIYTLGNEVYANITNRCDCNCTFCIRHNGSGVGDAQNLWYDREPSLEEILKAMDEILKPSPSGEGGREADG